MLACLRKDLGAPVTRQRIFILFAHKDVMNKKAAADFGGFCGHVKEQLMMELVCESHWNLDSLAYSFQSLPVMRRLRDKLLLPEHHWSVLQHAQKRMIQRKFRMPKMLLNYIVELAFQWTLSLCISRLGSGRQPRRSGLSSTGNGPRNTALLVLETGRATRFVL